MLNPFVDELPQDDKCLICGKPVKLWIFSDFICPECKNRIWGDMSGALDEEV